jgi:hypothetical protein
MAAFKRYLINKYKLIPEKNGFMRVEINDNPFHTIIATSVKVHQLNPEKYENPIEMSVFSTSKTTSVEIWDRTGIQKKHKLKRGK